jgi:hypothetical protein
MIEQYLQVALEFVKEIWFQLNSQFGLEETEAFKFIQPYLLQLLDNPTYMGIAFASLVLIPYGLYKVSSISRKREQKFEELMEEMEEEEEEDRIDDKDPALLRRSNSEIKEEDSPSYVQILEEFDEKESEDDFHVDTQKVMGTYKDIEPVSSELIEPQIDKDLSEFEEFEFVNDPKENYSELDNEEQDRAIKELQDEMESTVNKLTEQLEGTPETNSSLKDLIDIKIGEEATIDDELPLEDPQEIHESTSEVPELEALNLTGQVVESTSENIDPTIEESKSKTSPLQPIPERDYTTGDGIDRQAGSLINRLKYFQENLDTRFLHDDKREMPSVPKTFDFEEKHQFVEQQSFATRKAPLDNKKYMEVLESFIFLKDQNKHR